MKELPKNIRQIGNVSDSTKVYIEDYVDTYINQLRTRTEIDVQGIFFVGEILKEKTEEVYIVNGAILMQDVRIEGSNVICGKDTWKKGCKEAKESFDGKSIIGWALIKEGVSKKLSPQLAKLDERFFSKNQRLFMLIDNNEKEEYLYVYRFNGLMEMQGHFIYYEKNPLMQDYMISRRKESALPPSEAYEDRAAKDFRNIINQKADVKKHDSIGKRIQFSGVASVIALLAIGLVGINQYDTLHSIGSNVLGKFDSATEQVIEDVNQEVESEHLLTSAVGSTKPEIVDDELLNLESETSSVNERTEVDEDIDPATNDQETLDTKNTNLENASDNETLSDLVQETVSVVEYISYTVEPGDTLASISRMYYGNMGRVGEICEINNIDTRDFIVAGEVLKLPK